MTLTPEERKKRDNERHKKRWRENPEYKLSQITRRKTPEYKAAQSKHQKLKYANDPDYREKQSETYKKRHSDPILKEHDRILDNIRHNERYANDPFYREKCNERSKKRHSNPIIKAKRNAQISARQKERRATEPGYREKVNAQIAACQKKRLQEDPKYREYRKELRKTSHDRHKRELGWEPLNEWFEGSHGHHIDKERVIYIPKSLHLTHYGHRLDRPETMIEINLLAWNYLESSCY